MKNILISGATGNIGKEVIYYLLKLNADNNIIAAVRNSEKAKHQFEQQKELSFRNFDFENTYTFQNCFRGIDILFLLRPPHLANVDKTFKPLLQEAKVHGIQKIVFLSVQGAERSKVIPHNQIERLIKQLDLEYIFVRPSYFMQNLTTTLLPEIKQHQSITLPAGQAVFNWIDTKNIGEATAHLLLNFEQYKNKAYEITGNENKNFLDVANTMSNVIGSQITYKSMNPIRFFFKKKKEGMNGGFAFVITLLHFLPRLQSAPTISNNYRMLTGKEPTTIQEFIKRENVNFI